MNVTSGQYQLLTTYFCLFLRHKMITSTVTIIITATTTTGIKMAITIYPVRSEGELVSFSGEQFVPLQSSVGVEEGKTKEEVAGCLANSCERRGKGRATEEGKQ